jgi:hypothetical protein
LIFSFPPLFVLEHKLSICAYSQGLKVLFLLSGKGFRVVFSS